MILQPDGQLAFGYLPFTGATEAQHIDQGEQVVETSVFGGGSHHYE